MFSTCSASVGQPATVTAGSCDVWLQPLSALPKAVKRALQARVVQS